MRFNSLNIKILNIKYFLFFTLFLVICSLFFVAVPVFAKTTPPKTEPVSCNETDLKTLKNDKEFVTSKILPLCVYFEGTPVEAQCGCRNVNVLVSLLTKVANWLFGIVGAVALAVFIYGGFTILTAAGSSERVKKGKDALIAAVIGLVIVFTAQVGLKFLLKTVLPTDCEKKAGDIFDKCLLSAGENLAKDKCETDYQAALEKCEKAGGEVQLKGLKIEME